MLRALLLLLAIGAVHSGCTVGPNYHQPGSTMPGGFAAAYPQTQPATRPVNVRPVDMTRWWESMGDEELNSLVRRAVTSNLDLQIAFNRLQQVRTQLSVVTSGSLPVADLSGGMGRGSGNDSIRGRLAQPTYAGTNTAGYKEVTEAVGADLIWELDLWGKFRRQIEAVKADTQAAAEARNYVLVSMLSDVARSYVHVRSLELRLQILHSDLAAQQKSVEVVETRFARGITNQLDVALARRELAIIQAQIEPLEAARDAAKRRVAVLLGQLPDDLAGELASAAATIPEPPDQIDVGLPIDLLCRRPDIRQAERQLAADTARIGVATAYLFPTLVVTGGMGEQGQGLGRLPLKSAFIWSAGPTAYFPVLDFGALDALVNIQDLRARADLINYKNTILHAVEQVNDSVTNYSAQEDQLKNLANALVAANQAVTLASTRFDRGVTDFLNVVDAQRQYYALQDQYAQAQDAHAQEFINLCNGLGGGWETFGPAAPPKPPRPAILAAADRLMHPEQTGH